MLVPGNYPFPTTIKFNFCVLLFDQALSDYPWGHDEDRQPRDANLPFQLSRYLFGIGSAKDMSYIRHEALKWNVGAREWSIKLLPVNLAQSIFLDLLKSSRPW